MDQFTRECLALEVGRSMTSRGEAGVLIDLFTTRGVPERIGSSGKEAGDDGEATQGQREHADRTRRRRQAMSHLGITRGTP